jgi:hypothetical protein
VNESVSSEDTDLKAQDVNVKSSEDMGWGDMLDEQFHNYDMLALQSFVDQYIITKTASIMGKPTPPVVKYTSVYFPSPSYTTSGFWGAEGIKDMFAIMAIISTLFPVANVIRVLMIEKQTKMRESMAMMRHGKLLFFSVIFFSIFFSVIYFSSFISRHFVLSFDVVVYFLLIPPFISVVLYPVPVIYLPSFIFVIYFR